MIKSKINSIFRFFSVLLLSFVVSFFFAITFFGECKEKAMEINCPDPIRFFTSLFIFFLISSTIFYLISKRISFKKFIYNFILIIILLGSIYLFVAHPFRVSGGDAGPFKSGQTVFAATKYISIFNPVQKRNVVIYQRPDISTGVNNGVAYIVGVPGDKLPDNSYYFSKIKVDGEVVPAGFFASTFGQQTTTWLIPESNITYIVWYPFVK